MNKFRTEKEWKDLKVKGEEFSGGEIELDLEGGVKVEIKPYIWRNMSKGVEL
jgi:hypothetical protein